MAGFMEENDQAERNRLSKEVGQAKREGRDAADLELDEWAEMYFGEDAKRYRRTTSF